MIRLPTILLGVAVSCGPSSRPAASVTPPAPTRTTNARGPRRPQVWIAAGTLRRYHEDGRTESIELDVAIYNVFVAGQQWVATTEQWAAVEKLTSPYDEVTDEPRQLRGGPVERQDEPAWRMWDRASSPGSVRFGSFRCASDTLQVNPRRVNGGRLTNDTSTASGAASPPNEAS